MSVRLITWSSVQVRYCTSKDLTKCSLRRHTLRESCIIYKLYTFEDHILSDSIWIAAFNRHKSFFSFIRNLVDLVYITCLSQCYVFFRSNTKVSLHVLHHQDVLFCNSISFSILTCISLSCREHVIYILLLPDTSIFNTLTNLTNETCTECSTKNAHT